MIPENNYVGYGERIALASHLRNMRNSMYFTQDELAKALGTKRQYVGRMESAQADPTLLTLLSISRFYKLEIIDMIPDSFFKDQEILQMIRNLYSKAASTDKLPKY